MYKAEAVSPCGFRADGRLVHEARQLRCRTSVPPTAATAASAAAASASEAAAAAAAAGAAGCVTNCDGRAVVSLGCTKVMALVYGPQPSSSCSAGNMSSSGSWSVSISDTTSASLQLLQEGRQGKGRGDVATPLSVVCSVGFVGSSVRLRNMYTPDTAEVATAVRTAAEGVILRRLYTQTRITISLLVLADDGCKLVIHSVTCVNQSRRLWEYMLTFVFGKFVERDGHFLCAQFEEKAKLPKRPPTLQHKSPHTSYVSSRWFMTITSFSLGCLLTRIPIALLVVAVGLLARSILSACLIAASLALADAGVAMRDLLPACTVMLLPQHQPQKGSLMLLDPTNDEARTGGPSLTVGITAQTNDVVALQLSGKVDRESYAEMFDLCLRGCLAAAECMKDALRDAADTRMLLSS
ncbi:hypothetical protein Esti_005890 [Eimeria stiedai]